MIKAVIVDDEQHCIDRLTFLIHEYNSGVVEISSVFKTAEAAGEFIPQQHPDLVFLDVELGLQNGFDLLKQFSHFDFEVIFVTAHDRYAAQAFRFSAFDYLMKPVDKEQLCGALQKLNRQFSRQEQRQKMEALLYNLSNRATANKRICIPTAEGFTLAQTEEIVRCEALTNYTTIFFHGSKKITVARTLKDFEEMLAGCDFFRVHNSHLVNLKYVKSYRRGKGGVVTLMDGTQLEVSTRRKDAFLKRIADSGESGLSP